MTTDSHLLPFFQAESEDMWKSDLSQTPHSWRNQTKNSAFHVSDGMDLVPE